MVQDIPLLVETGQGSSFHLVVVVDAPDDVRVRRMVEHRNMTVEEARSRMAAQAGRDDRLAAADVVLDNSGTPEDLRHAVDGLWEERLVPVCPEPQRSSGSRPRTAGRSSAAPTRTGRRQAARLIARLQAAAPEDILAVDHIGSTAVPGLEAKDVIDLQLGVRDLDAADRIAPLLADAGFPRWPGIMLDNPRPHAPGPRRLGQAAPRQRGPRPARECPCPRGRIAGLAVSPCASATGSRADPRRAGRTTWPRSGGSPACTASDKSTAGYAADKERWFTDDAGPGMEAWAQRTGWQPPSYADAGDAPPHAGDAVPGTAQS